MKCYQVKRIGDEGYKKAAQKVSDLYKLGAFGENPLEQGNDDANAAFENGKAAMRIMGSWFANNVYTDEAATVNPEEVVALKIPMILTEKENQQITVVVMLNHSG